MKKSSIKYLYHYTTIDTLALILKNRSILFNRADCVNDLEEINILDKPEVKKSSFISCWTAKKNESIPMWNLYANEAKGVRIKLKNPFFEGSTAPHEIIDHNCKIITLKNIQNFIERENDYEWLKYLFGPIEVNYGKNTGVNVLKDDNSLIVEKIGTIKSKHWEFEEEFRFLALANHDWNSHTETFEFKNEPYYSEVKSDCFEIKIDETIFCEIEVTLGPCCQESEEIIVESLLKEFTTNGRLRHSDLKDKIRCKKANKNIQLTPRSAAFFQS